MIRLQLSNTKIGRTFAVCLLFSTLYACGGDATNRSPDSGLDNAEPDTGAARPESAEGMVVDGQGNLVDEMSMIDLPTPATTDPVEEALRTGDANAVEDSNLLVRAALEKISEDQEYLNNHIIDIFRLDDNGTARGDGSSLNSLDWNPTHDAAVLSATFGTNVAILKTNNAYQDGYEVVENTIGVIGDSPERYMVLGGNPMRNHYRSPGSINEQMHQFLENGIAWLTDRRDMKTSSFNVVIAQLNDGYYFPDERAVRAWLDERYPEQAKYNDADTCDDALLASCIQDDTDLLIISQQLDEDGSSQRVRDAVEQAMLQGVPVLYMHLDGGLTELGTQLLSLFDTQYAGDNYWRRLELASFDITQYLNAIPEGIQSVQTLLRHFEAQDIALDWSACENENCNDVPGLATEYQAGASYVKNLMNDLDSRKIDLFSSDGQELQKLLALLGDHYRQNVVFPMDKLTTDSNALMKSWYADHAVYNYRLVNQAQRDMGTFSRSDFSNITPVSRRVTLTSKVNFRSAGVYALPGETVRVTRSDTSDLDVKIFVNTQRSGSTHQWATDGYSRPKYLQSAHMEIEHGETIYFTSPYGGPVQLEFSANDLPVDLTFNNIGEHPYWNGSSFDDSFAAGLDANDYDWAELISPSFEVHSSNEKMRNSLQSAIVVEQGGNAEALAAATVRYVHNFPHVLAGFQGPGVDVVPEIHQFAAERGIELDNLDKVKHMNADQATCGYGCSGNPYDAYWSFNPIGHGDLHELGHGLERWRFRFNGWETHTSTNMYSYYSKSQYFKDTGSDPACQSLPFERSYNTLQQSLATTDPQGYVKTNHWDPMGWSEGAAMFIQMLMAAQDSGAVIDGWHLLPRLHILEREFNRATANEATWIEKREILGFSQYSLADAKSLDQNDWLLIAVSSITGFDHRDYFTVWALPFSASAADQVAAFGYPSQPLYFYVSSGRGFCMGEGFDGRKLPLNGGELLWPDDA